MIVTTLESEKLGDWILIPGTDEANLLLCVPRGELSSLERAYKVRL